MVNLAQNILAFGSVGWPELLVILVIALVIFGKRLPEVARSLGRSLTEFKKGMNETKDEIHPMSPLANSLRLILCRINDARYRLNGLNDQIKL